jgi:hypothetical protein
MECDELTQPRNIPEDFDDDGLGDDFDDDDDIADETRSSEKSNLRRQAAQFKQCAGTSNEVSSVWRL